MEKSTDLEVKYQKLAAEYSKVRSHATVLKKAVLDEQGKILELKETVKEQEQKIRKHDQEMESLTFRNEQLTKRISVLQQELQINNHTKKGKSKAADNNIQSNYSVLDEELHKKILENATLVSTMADKDMEISNNKDKIEYLEGKMLDIQRRMELMEQCHKDEITKMKIEDTTNMYNTPPIVETSNTVIAKKTNKEVLRPCDTCTTISEAETNQWKQEIERWRAECELLRSKPESNENLSELSEFYESQITTLLSAKQLCESESSVLWADKSGLQVRLEHLILEKNALESILEKSNEELHTTSQNYKQQLDAMTEHIATQNERITKLSDEVEFLKHKLSIKK